MVYLSEISRNELPEFIQLSYSGDEDLLEKYHIARFTLQAAVHSTLDMVDKMAARIPLVYMKVMFEENPIGYVIKSGRFLYSFAIAIKYRTAEVLKMWWDALKENLGGNFTCALLTNNTRAIEYMKERGMKVLCEDEETKEIYFTN